MCTLSEVPCIPVSLTVLGLVHLLEETIKGLDQSVKKISSKEQTRIIVGSDYKTIWYPRTVQK